MQKGKRILIVCACLAGAFLIVSTISDLIAYKKEINYGRTAMYLSDAKYKKTLGVDRLRYAAFLKTYGGPEKVEHILRSDGEPLMVAIYPGFSLQCYFNESSIEPIDRLYPHVIRVIVHDPAYRFGWLRIGVGSPRYLVQLAYLLDPPLDESSLEYYQPVDEGYYGEDWCAFLFCYDANDRVETMTYAIAPN